MTTKARLGATYLRFLELAEAICSLPSLPALDPLEERMLGSIARANDEGADLSVRTMMSRVEFGAPATIHTRLKSMRAKGWILLSDTEDARRKQVELSQAALMHFDKLSKCVMKAASTTR
ncbi:winged helix-turn-helix domain-containing protein [Noviherbaspirillum pedocola]|uniref:Winged helix-turn-helix domain-containing protein n=1 Tax=Noviherbaspirillum pedocola TaxID=2801341 RepID=A0A934SV45_9BURK|nr:winged helix-turn-helix domain-containing protein [Noviherbaspirillum pedocola]MBK4736144.1 winged helix-turn-helix domain-containing protein [Noviherbaspirillum pedocola]